MNVAIIGAGAAGLITAHIMKSEGCAVTIFEARDRLGGTWAYDERIDVRCSMYRSLRTNLPKEVISFSEFDFSEENLGERLPVYPGHAKVLAYLQAFEAEAKLRPSLRLGCEVERIEPEMGGWRVRWSGASGEAHFDRVAVCNGHYSRPRSPELPGLEVFEGRLLHSHNYRVPDGFQGQRVAILGAKGSGMDIAFELAQVSREVHLCARSHETPSRFGRRNNIFARPTIVALEKRAARLSDGGRIGALDALVFCTGYHFDFPFLPGGLIRTEDDYVTPLYRELLWLNDASLAFIGLPLQVAPFRLFEIQARFVAACWTQKITLPNLEARRAWLLAHERKLHEAGVAKRHWLRHGDRQFDYYNSLARDCGQPPLPVAYAEAYRASRRARKLDPENYRALTDESSST